MILKHIIADTTEAKRYSNVAGMGGLAFGGQAGIGAEKMNAKYGECFVVLSRH